MHSTKIIIVDDHPLVRSGLRRLIETEPDFSVCGEAATIRETLKSIAKVTPDLAIIDLSLADGNGLDLIKHIHAIRPSIKVLVSSMHDEDMFAERALRAGAHGYINKQETGDEVILAMRQVLNGNTYLSPVMRERLKTDLEPDLTETQRSPIEKLSNRELAVFELIGHGMSTSMIADKLHLSVKTIESHRSHIKLKLGLHTANELTRLAIQWTLDTL